MTYGGEGLSASDIALLTNGNRNNGNGLFGDGNGAWFIILFLIFAVFGFGNGFGGFGGFGGNGAGAPIILPTNGGGAGVMDNYVLASDFATLQRQIDSATATLERKADATQQGLCDGFYAMNTGMLNGFSGVQNTLCQGFSGVNQNIVTNGYETRLGTQALQAELADCCCKTQSAIQGVNYNLATQSCDTRNTINTGFNNLMQANCINTRDIIDNINASYNNLHNEIVANRIEDKNAQIQAQQNEINALRLSASQERQNSFLISRLNPTPQPSYVVQPPAQVSFPTNCNGTFTGYNTCGCNC